MAEQQDTNLSALLELCDAQHHTIERLQRALGEYEEAEGDRHLIKKLLAHELRTPLTAVIATLHTMALPNLDADQHEDLRSRALRQAGQLNDMIEDILSLSEPYELAVDRAPQDWVDVFDLADDVRVAVEPFLAHDRFEVDVPEGLMLRTVPNRVRQVIVNLVVNAAKYSPQDASVRLVARRRDDQVIFEVHDDGPGIPSEIVESLFEPGSRGTTGGAEGAGLGLYLVRMLVGSLRGTVELLAPGGGGTVARVVLPQRRLEDASRPVPGGREHRLHVVRD